MPTGLTEEKRELLNSFLDSLPTTPGLAEEELRLLDTLSRCLLRTPCWYWWFNLEVLSRLAQMWQLKFKGAPVDYTVLQTLLRRLFQQHSKVVLGVYEILHRRITHTQDGQERPMDLYLFQCHRDNALAAIRYHKGLLGEDLSEVPA